jgi:hypothetical protein
MKPVKHAFLVYKQAAFKRFNTDEYEEKHE